MSTQEVHSAIQSLYGQNGGAAQQAANQFLVQFASTDGAWEVALGLLGVNDPAVQYFGANMLYGKIRSDWSTLPEPHQGPFMDAMGNHLTKLASRPGSNLAARRLCLTMAAAATRVGPSAAYGLVDKALALACVSEGNDTQGVVGITLALEMQAAIAEETNDAASSRDRQNLVDALVARLVDVLGTAEMVFGKSAGDATLSSLRCAALHAALAWLRLDEKGGGGIVLSPGQLAGCRGTLLQGALAALISDDTKLREAATEFCVAVLAYGAPPSVVPGEDENVVRGMVASLVNAGNHAVNPDHEEIAMAVCKVAVAVVERDATDVAGENASPEFLQLTSLVLTLVETHTTTHVVMEAACDYFLMVNTVPFQQRHPGLRQPLFHRLLGACVQHATLPLDFTTWQNADFDRDTWVRFREQILCDLLDNCFGILPTGYLGFISNKLDTAQSWQEIESATFAARAAAGAVKRLVTQRASERDSSTQSETSDRTTAGTWLRTTLTRIGDASQTPPPPSSQIFASHPLVIAGTCRLVGAFAPWLGLEKNIEIPQKCASYLLLATTAPGAFRFASGAFRDVCARCADFFASTPGTLDGILEAATRAMPDSPPPNSEESFSGSGPGANSFGGGFGELDDDRSGVVEGLARVVAAVTDPAAAVAAAKKLTAPIVARALRHAEKAQAGSGSPLPLAHELKLLASAVRFLEFPNFDEMTRRAASCMGNQSEQSVRARPTHPAVACLSEAWPALAAFNAEPWRSSAEITDAVCQVYQKTLLSAKQQSVTLLPHILEALKNTFVAHRHVSCLDCLAVATETFSEVAVPSQSQGVGNPEIGNAIEGVFVAVVDAAAACLSTHPIAENADLARALFEYAHKHALFAPAAFLTAKSDANGGLVCHELLSLALATLATREAPDAMRSAVTLVNSTVQPGDKASASHVWRTCRPVSVDAFFASRGEAVVKALLVSGADSAPRLSLPRIAQTLHAIQMAYNDPGRSNVVDAWIRNALSDPRFPCPDRAVDERTRRAFCGIVAAGHDGPRNGQPPPPRRWAACCVDFFQIARGELGADALLGYQM